MSKRGHTEEQILRALRQAQGGTKISDICREQGISEATYYVWKKKYAGLELSELCEFRVELLPSGALRGYSRVDLSLASSIFARRYIASVKLSVQGVRFGRGPLIFRRRTLTEADSLRTVRLSVNVQEPKRA